MPMSDKQFRILYLEDDPENYSVDLSNLRRHENLHFTVARSCEEARRLLGAEAFDLFILDIEIKMSRESGIQFAEELRADPRYSAAPIIFASIHTHYSSALLSHIKNSSFLSKPFEPAILAEQVYLMLHIPEYVKQHYSYDSLVIPTAGNAFLEVKPATVSYMEATGQNVLIQYINGETLTLSGRYGVFKRILHQIRDREIRCLRQIHRSVIINVNQISDIRMEKNVGVVYLFADETPKPVGIKYRKNLSEFLGGS